MSEPRLPAGYRHSVFGKLLTIMLVMAGTLLVLVLGFFLFYIGPNLDSFIGRVAGESARLIAASAPDLETARRLSPRLDLDMRYEGPAGVWSTAEDLPPIGEVRRQGKRAFGPHYDVVAAPDGGAYLFHWTFRRKLRAAHLEVLALLVVLMAAVFLAAHGLLHRLLQPLRGLGEGVARLSEGELDVTIANPTRDEFGALTAAFNQMVGRVRGMIGARDQLLLDVSHELRSPLTRLKVALEMTPEGRTRSGMAADLAEMEVMIGELLELERLREGGIRTAPTDVVALLDAVAASYRDRPPGVAVAAAPPEILLDLDADKMRTVVRNLLENAVKYSLPDSRPVEVSAASAAEGVVIRVADDGPGIPATDLASVFEPFFRVDRSRSKKTGGYGLGLSIARRIVEAHRGTLSVHNNPGRGATFVITLPGPPPPVCP
ncbi:MAG TPA: HAMP domain-containing sensor histidine kinase [Thermoanaerobaculia bacterium]|jgi:signal transduction histidine kinase|nr:HAMP domain-containing sensor histidine kinase [Thermoanaerobaculia bacterium]